MSIFSWFKSAPKAVDNVLDKDNGLLSQFGGWIGGQQFTEQEKAEHMAKAASLGLEHMKATMGESTERSKTRRDVAVLWIRLQVGLVVMCAMWVPFKTEIAKTYFELATSDLMLFGTLTILTFFFGSHLLSSHAPGLKGIMTKGKK